MTIGIQNGGLTSLRVLCPRITLPCGKKVVTPVGPLNWGLSITPVGNY